MAAFVFLYLAVYFIIENFISILYAMLFVVKSIFNEPNASGSVDFKNFESALYQNYMIIKVISAFITLSIYWFVMWLRKEKILNFCGFSRIGRKSIALTALIGVALVLPVDFIVGFLSIDKLSPGTEKAFNSIFEGNSFFVLLLGIGILGPIVEEILFRGLVFNELRKNMPVALAVVLQGLAFGAYHMNWTQFLYAAPLGILFGLVYLWTRSIWSTILVHIFFNTTGVVIAQYFNEQKFLNIFTFTLSLIVAVIILVSLWFGRVKHNKKVL